VKLFQARYGVEPDGIVGPATARAIDRALPARPRPLESIISTAPAAGKMAAIVGDRVLELGARNEAVRALQLALAELGYPITATGYFGGGTDTVVKDFQARHGLDSDGAVGRGTAAAIDRALAARAAENSHAQLNGCERPLWLIEGMNWVGTKEAAGTADNPAIRKWATEEGGEIAKVYNHDSIPWCSLYANMVLSKVGLRGTETLWALDWEKWGNKLPGPAVGAFAPMKRQGGGHIAIVVGRDQNGNLMCLGGNQEDAVNIKPFPAERPLSFRWPEGVPQPTRVGFDTLPLIKSEGGVSTQEA
jgi:uncharacterized protein (TIGR02594 family)